MTKDAVKNTLILFCITVIAGLLLGFVFHLTKAPIAKQEKQAKEQACTKVFESAAGFGTKSLDVSDQEEVLADKYGSCTVEEWISALDENEEVIGGVLTVTCSDGYGGDITILMGIDSDEKVLGIAFLALNETAGLGMNAKEPSFIDQFADKSAQIFSVTKDTPKEEGDIQAISSATITSNAVVKAVNAGLEYYRYKAEQGGSVVNE